MSYTINYNQATRGAKLHAALNDAKAYLGEATFNKVVGYLILEIETNGIRSLAKCYRLGLSFAGIQGLPAHAMTAHAISIYRARKAAL